MDNTINKVLKTIYHNIPIEILEVTFGNNEPFNNITLDESIIRTIIEGRILDDVNVGCGKKKEIILKANYLRFYSNGTTSPWNDNCRADAAIYVVPPEAREHRNISSVVSIKWTNRTFNIFPYGGTTTTSLARDALYTNTRRDMEYLPRPILLDNNIIRLDPPTFIYSDITLVCFLEYDKYFTNISDNAIKSLCNLILSATKAYIYNTLYIKMNRTSVMGGHEIGAFREIVETYSGEWERYDELLKKFRGSSSLDTETIVDIIKLALP
jgi:hypothetical protein